MRQIDTVRRRFRDEVSPHYSPVADMPTTGSLMNTELCLHLLESVARGQAARGVPALLDGYNSLWDVVANPPPDAAVRIANARTLLWRVGRPYIWKHALDAYQRAPERIRGYTLDEFGRPVRRDCSVAPHRFAWYERVLTEPLPFAQTRTRPAEPGRHRMASTARGIGVNIPHDLPIQPPAPSHDLVIRQRRPIEVSWDDVLATALAMDDEDRTVTRPHANWAGRLREITLQMRAADDRFHDSTTLTVDRMLHMVGLVSVGKTTLVTVLAVWAAQHDRFVTIVVGDNSSALRATRDLSRYRDVRAAPVMGRNRTRHAERLHHLQPPPSGRLLPRDPYGFELVSTACALGAVAAGSTPLEPREAPCHQLVVTDDDATLDGWRERPRRTCPLWHGCQRHEAARRLVDANVWIATPWSLVHTPVPDPVSAGRVHYLEAAWRRSDLVIVDEADQVQANFDQMFADVQILLGPSREAWIDEIGVLMDEKLRSTGRAPVRYSQIRQFDSAQRQARSAAGVIYQLLQRDRSRPGKPVLSWLDGDYFTSWTLFDALAKDWAGYHGPKDHRPDSGWDVDKLYRALRREFNMFIDDPNVASGDITAGLTDLADALLAELEEDVREERARSWLRDITERGLADDRRIVLSDQDRAVWRLEFAVAVAVMAHRLNLMLSIWPQVAAELDLSDALTTEVRRPPTDLAVVVPESPMGNVLGFQYVEDDRAAGDGELGEFRFFRYSGVGRALLVGLPDLFPADGPGPNVLLLSGTSWAGSSPRYHIDVPVRAILKPSPEKLAAIEHTTFTLDIQHTGEYSTPIWVSGRYGTRRADALRQMVAALTRPGAGPGRPNRLERERTGLPKDRAKIMLLVGSYAEARTVTEELLRIKSSWTGQVRCLIGDDEPESGRCSEHLLRRSDVAEFGTSEAWLLVAPVLAVERGHNILNVDGAAAIGAALFLVRPHPRPKDLGYVTQRINQYAVEQLRRRPVSGDIAAQDRLAEASSERRRAAQRQWRRLLHSMVAYSHLADDERDRVAWTQLVSIWQVVGRLLRGGQPAKIYFCDAAFAPRTARRSVEDADVDDASTSLLYGMRHVLAPYFEPSCSDPDRHLVQALYTPLHAALTSMGDR